MTEEIIVLQPGDERAQKVAKAISSQTANDILHMLSEGQKTASDLTEALHIPMGTLKYHIENLLDAGLIEVSETKYSVKGREVKVYRIRDQLLIVAPTVKNLRSILVRYASLFGIVVFASLVMLALMPLFQPATILAPGGVGTGDIQYQATKESWIVNAAPRADVVSLVVQPQPSPDPVIAFFLGGCLVLLVLFLYEAYSWQKGKY